MCKQAPKPKLNQTKAALEEAYELKQSKRWGVEFGGWGKRSTSGSFGWGKRSLELTTPPPESEATMIHNVGVMPEDDEWAIFRGTPWGKRSLPPPEPMAPAPARAPDVVYAVRLTGADQERYVANLRPVEYYQGLINQISSPRLRERLWRSLRPLLYNPYHSPIHKEWRKRSSPEDKALVERLIKTFESRRRCYWMASFPVRLCVYVPDVQRRTESSRPGCLGRCLKRQDTEEKSGESKGEGDGRNRKIFIRFM